LRPGQAQARHAHRHRSALHRRARHVRVQRREAASPLSALLGWLSRRAGEPGSAAPAAAAEQRTARRRHRQRIAADRPESAGAPRAASSGAFDAAIARHAQANGVPEHLVRRVIVRESRYNASAVGRGGTMGLMQIKPATARSMGYTGSSHGLLDADTNLTYAVRYLAGAYRAAGGNPDRAMAYYASGYHGRGVRGGRRAARQPE
jgi:soluble lytic murein transglycosylase-like protein